MVGQVERGGLPLWKRALDLAIIMLLAPGLLLASMIVALVIKLGSQGPVFFSQNRVGYRGREFVCYKFRTMRPNAETQSHQNHTQELINSETPMTKLDARKDPRLIPGGVPIRALGLDELPQLLNVLKGEMSVVGPRPCMPYEYELYKPWQRRRFEAVPGLTGLWQVNGKNRTTFTQMIRLDIEYAERRSLLFDLRILFRTFPAVWQQFRDSRARSEQEVACVPSSITKPAQSYRI